MEFLFSINKYVFVLSKSLKIQYKSLQLKNNFSDYFVVINIYDFQFQ